jgi:hypothetical protein
MLGNAGKAANVSKQYGDCLVNPAEFKRLGILEHLFDYIFGQEPTVVCPRHFLTRETLVGSSVLHCNRRLRGDGAD